MKSNIKLKNLLISIGSGYHPGVRLLHSMVKDKSESYILIFNLEKPQLINEDLRKDSSVKYHEFQKSFDLLKHWLLENQFELIGISFMSHSWDIFACTTDIIREALPDCKIIAGGVHAWRVNPTETLKHCDYVCAAEGEELYSKLVDILSASKDACPLRIPGLIEKNGKEVIHTPVKGYLSLDNLPLPTLGSKEVYSLYSLGDNPIFKNEDPYLNSFLGIISASRGCPFKCTYCINSLIKDRKIRSKSVDKVIEEIKAELRVSKLNSIYFMDEVFPLKYDWLKEFSTKYKDNIGLPFAICLYPGMITYEKAKLLKEAGLKEVSMGIQSGSERIRKNVYERLCTNNKIIEDNRIFSSLNIMTYYDFIIKNPFESEEDYRESLNLVHTLKQPFYLKFYTLAYYPGHPITKMALANGLIEPKDVNPAIGFLDVATPHKVAIMDHYNVENLLVIWHQGVRKAALLGSIEAQYYLLIAYHGFWFIPRFISGFLRSQFINKRPWILYIFSSLVQFTLLIRNNSFIKKTYFRIVSCREKGFVYTISKIWMKMGLKK